MPLISADDARASVLGAFVAPPASICLAWLLTRIAIHYSVWEAVPAFLLAVAIGTGSCLMLAGRFAVRQRGRWVVPRFIAWLMFSAAYAVGGLFLIDLLPLSVGDGP
jgi:hypothetical protein